MSSTNRSKSKDRHKFDYYITPQKPILQFLEYFSKYENVFENPNTKILDCCCGGDELHEASYPVAIRNIYGNVDMDLYDIREDSKADFKEDYLLADTKDKYDVIISNPPFDLSYDFILKALDDVKENGFVIMLLRLNYFGGKVRSKLWKEHMPKYCFVHNKRISFTQDNKTDSIEYCHMVWQKGYKPKFTDLQVIIDE